MARSPILLPIMATIAIFGLIMVASPCAAQNTLISPHSLRRGQFISNGRFRLTVRPDCNVVLQDGGIIIWQTNTFLPPAVADCRLKLYENGNLAVYDRADRMLWQTGTNGKVDTYALVLQSDRNLVIYGPVVWATYTDLHSVGPNNATATATVDAAAEQVIKSVAA